jgi:hypothetical protein
VTKRANKLRLSISSQRWGSVDQVFLHPNYGNPDGATSVLAGGLMLNGRSVRVGGG